MKPISRTYVCQAVCIAVVIAICSIVSLQHSKPPSTLTPNVLATRPQVVDLAAVDRGFKVLVDKPLLSADMNDAVFNAVWESWPEPLKQKAESASPAQRRQMAFDRYGLTPRPGDLQASGTRADSAPQKPLQYVVGDDGVWTMNCFACHGGTVYGRPWPGAPNNRFALQTMTEEIRAAKLRTGTPLSRMDFGALVVPLGTTHGTTNAVVFGQGLMSRRDEQLNVVPKLPGSFTHHDMDAPPWWYFYKRPYIYIDGFAQRGHRGLMQFALIPENGPQFFRDHEEDFKDVHAYLMSLRPPKYDGPIDRTLAGQGRAVFKDNCAECHGTYGEEWTYPNRCVSIDEIGTDPVRLTALEVAGREKYARSWFAHGGEPEQQQTVTDPTGYVAPPLDGIWASAPYFHNGSVPTIWGVLSTEDRPRVWRPTSLEMDAEKVGLQVEAVEKIPFGIQDIAIKRAYFDTARFGKSNAGHNFGNALSDQEKQAVIEYLKTL